MSKSRLFVNRFAVSQKGHFIYNEPFHKGVNIIRGANGTGKSTIADLLSYALGSVITEWTKEQLSCDWVIVEVLMNNVPFCLKRDITESGQAKMSIFEGTFDEANNSILNWTQYSIRRSDERHSYSQQIFEMLNLPRHKTDDSKNLTLHQIFRLMYVDQLSATSKLLKEDNEYDNATYRRAIGEYLLGIDDLEAHNLRQELIAANKKYESLNGELNAIYRLFGNEVSKINEQALDNEIMDMNSQLAALRGRKKDILRAQPSELSDLVKAKALSLQGEIDLLSSNKLELEDEKSMISIELIDTELFLTSLNDRKSALEQSRLTYTSLGGVTFKYCPSCLEPVPEETHSGCCLCKTEIRPGERDIAYVQMLNELNFQIRESETLIEDFRKKLDDTNSKLPGINKRIAEAKFEYQELDITVESKDAVVSEIASEMGFLKSQMLSLEDRRAHINKVDVLRSDREQALTRIQKIQDKISQMDLRQAARYNYVYDSIEAKASHLLGLDGSYEPTFDSVEEVNFDFAKDKMFVNGRSKFSASSMVVMKNCIRLAIFLHAVDDDEARLPNFMIMDNIEDKGMVEQRSQNFQKIVVSECQKLKNEYQLIFTTSMIDPVLNGTNLCVGDMYTKGTHTLALT
ncbi:AAA family ATPase [Methylotenera sp.]|uniref:AAA family ATPase n=1 Tax=Methylotenera sp. TaxID=2051956 RepID=UPI002734DEA0|nr:AAA family ATPase [Methylotenera sp.]MDP3778402.1 AAA family ATPase [Methylotenera sp.]